MLDEKINKKEKIKRTVIQSTNILLFLLIINLLAGNMGIFNPILTRILAFFLLASVAIININFKNLFKIIKKPRKDSFKKMLLGLILLIISNIVLFATFTRELWLIQIPIFILGLDLFLQGMENKRREFFALAVSSFSYTLFIIFLQNTSIPIVAIQQFSLLVSEWVGFVSKPVSLGPSISGFWILLTFIFYIAASFFLSEERKNRKNIRLFMLCTFGLVIVWIIYILIQSLYPFATIFDRINSLYIVFIFNSIVILPFTVKSKEITFSTYVPKFKEIKFIESITRWRVVALCLMLFFSALFMTTFTPGFSYEEKRNIAIYQPGIGVGVLNMPEYGVYGKHASGFFGFFPKYLESSDYNLEIIKNNITEGILDRNDMLVIINLDEEFSDQTLHIIWNFVEKGGSLLVMGDHTDIGGIQKPLNRLLRPVGISFRFDSGLSAKPHWKSCYYLMHHPINEGIDTHEEFGISVGASLDIDITKSSFPIILGKGGFSDHGNYLDPERSFLGDYKYNSGEQLGDIILVAGAYYGKGRVLVFGDTTTFQNLVLSSSYPFVMNIVTWLTSSNTATSHYSKMVLSLIFLCFALVIYKKLNKKFFIIFPIIICISLITSSAINSNTFEETEIHGPIFYIDISHGERINTKPFQMDSITGLMLNLARNEDSEGNRLLPLMLKDFSEEKILNSKILVLIAPTEPIDKGEAGVIEKFVSNGGLLILSTGYNDKEASRLILEKFGFDISAKPLGPVPYTEENPELYRTEPRFVDAWPILIKENDNNTHIFYSIDFNGEIYDLVVFKKYGDGGILLIGDSQFLLEENLESMDDYWIGNITFLRDILQELKKEGVP